MDVALALKAREVTAGLQEHEEARRQPAEGAPRVLVVLALGDPVVVLDVLGEVAELLWRRVGGARHGAEARRQTVVIVVAAHGMDLGILSVGVQLWLVAGERRRRVGI